MRSITRQVVFQAGSTEYCWQDVLLASALWGRWQEIERQAKLALAALKWAENADESPVDDDAVQAAADEFRYSRNLLTAEEMEAWLATWELDVDAWMTWVVADHLRRKRVEEWAHLEPETSGEELESAIWAEAVFSTTLIRTAHLLTEKVAVAERVREAAESLEREPAGPLDGTSFVETPELSRTLDGLGLGVPRDEVRKRLAFLSGLDRTFDEFRASVLDEASLTSRIKIHQTDWTRVSVRMLRFDSEDAAREALISVRDDGSEMAEVASDAGARLVEGTFFLESFEPATRDHILSAPVGGLLGPLQSGDEWMLASVEAKQLPQLVDGEIRSRAEADLLKKIVGREVDNRISWRWGQ